MSTFSQSRDVKPDPFAELPASSGSRNYSSAGDASGGLQWTPNGPMLKLENAVVETVVTHTTRTTTSFAPIALPKIPVPEAIPRPSHLSPALYPLADAPCPEDMRVYGLNLGGRRVLVQEDESVAVDESPRSASASGPGWVRALPGESDYHSDAESMNLTQALMRSKGKEHKKRPHDFTGLHNQASSSNTPPITADPTPMRPRRSPPRKKIRGLEDLTISHESNNAPLSPLPSPDSETIPLPSSAQTEASQPDFGNGTEIAALFSLPSIVAHYETLPDKLQQQVLMHLLRRSRMPTIQRTCAFASRALKRDFVSQLPHEIAVQVLKKFDRQTLAVATRVSKRWHRIIETERVVWLQRLVDDDLYYGHGVEQEDEQLMAQRMDTLEWHARHRRSKRFTPQEDDDSDPLAGYQLPLVRPAPLKHVYRRRFQSKHNWLHSRPDHMSFPGHGTNVITSLQFDSDKIVTASDDHSINVYSLKNGQLRRRFDSHEGGVWALQYRGDTLVTGSTDRTVRIWDLESLTEMHVFHGHTSTVRCLQIVEPILDPVSGEYQPPYPMIVTGSRDSTLRVWKLPKKGEPRMSPQYDEEGEEIPIEPEQNPWHVRALLGHGNAVRALAAHGRICISGSYDHELRVWDIVTGQCKQILRGHEERVYSVAYDRHRDQCTSGSMDHTVKVWNVATGECLHTLVGHTSLIGLLGLSPNHIVSAAADSSLRVWDANTHKLKHTLASHGGAISCFKHDETKVVSGSNGALKLWDLQNGEYVRDLVVGITDIWQVAFNGNLLVSVANRNGTTVFDVFDFGGASNHVSGVDDESLDALRRPPWERSNPREPRTYQIEEMDEDMDDSSPSSSRRASTSATRRSSRLAHLTAAKAEPNLRASFPSDPTVARGSGRRSTRRPHLAVEYSPSPSGPSNSSFNSSSSSRHVAGESSLSQNFGDSFAPIFDDWDASMEDVKEEIIEEEEIVEGQEYTQE